MTDEFKPGDEVYITIKGVVTYVSENEFRIDYKLPDGSVRSYNKWLQDNGAMISNASALVERIDRAITEAVTKLKNQEN